MCGPALAHISAVTDAMEQNQLLAGAVENILPCLSGKILPVASAQWPSWMAPGTVKEGAVIRAERGSLPANAGLTTRETIYQQSKPGPEGPIEI
jgi:hypothetical protein